MKSPQNVSGEHSQHRSSLPFFQGQHGGSSFFKPVIQPKLSINAPNDQYEQEADHMADQVMQMQNSPAVTAAPPIISSGPAMQRQFTADKEEDVMRKEENSGEAPAPDKLVAQLDGSKGSGSMLPEGTRGSMEQFFKADFSGVRVHTGEPAAQMSRNIQAKAFTHGNDIYFNEGQYAPESNAGKHLLAHELTHTVQQNGGTPPAIQRYTDEEILAMREFQETGEEDDIQMAADRGFVPGDIVFRAGSTALGLLTGLPVTHGGIYIGNGLIHDVVGFGNRFVRVTNFFSTAQGEAANPDTFRIMRFIGPMSAMIIERLLSNIEALNFRMPTGTVPFNLFSSADNYETATCLEYAHAQFLYAIHEIATDPGTSALDLATLRATYFSGSGSEPDDLIRADRQSLMGYMPTPSLPSDHDILGTGGGRSPSAIVTEAALIAAASFAANNVDPTVFQNRSESDFRTVYPGGPGVGGTILNMFTGPSHDEVTLDTFTYQSFRESKLFFREMTTHMTGAPAALGR